MNIKELEAALAEKGLTICPICGTPFKPYHSNQKSCASPECKQALKRERAREWREKKKAEDIIAWRAYRAEATRKTRHKKRSVERAEERLEKLEEYTKRIEEQDKRLEDGINYGKRQAEKTLAQVPKIDVNLVTRKESEE